MIKELEDEIREFPKRWVEEAGFPAVIVNMIKFNLQGFPFLFPSKEYEAPTIRRLMLYCELLVMASYSSGEDLALCLKELLKLLEEHKNHEEVHTILEKTFSELMGKRMNFSDDVPLSKIV